ncbi:MAG: hypothetical protein RPR97_00260, partial [Colwellia sp.]
GFINNVPVLKSLKVELNKYMKMILVKDSEPLSHDFDGIPKRLKKAYVEAFKSPRFVGGYSRDFWLQISRLNTGAAGALLKVLDENFKGDNEINYSPKVLFVKSKEKLQAGAELVKIENIEKIEPFLADVDLMFSLMTTQKTQSKNEVIKTWGEFNRDAETLSSKAEAIYDDKDLVSVLSGSGLIRINKLLALRNTKTLSEQFDLVVDYHNYIMKKRNQGPWLKLDSSNVIKVFVKQRKKPNVKSRTIGTWVNRYYISQFTNLVAGFQGVKREAIN